MTLWAPMFFSNLCCFFHTPVLHILFSRSRICRRQTWPRRSPRTKKKMCGEWKLVNFSHSPSHKQNIPPDPPLGWAGLVCECTVGGHQSDRSWISVNANVRVIKSWNITDTSMMFLLSCCGFLFLTYHGIIVVLVIKEKDFSWKM